MVRALTTKLARALSISADDIEQGKQLGAYGVDSLMAVELRNWIARDFGANIAVFEIMGGGGQDRSDRRVAGWEEST